MKKIFWIAISLLLVLVGCQATTTDENAELVKVSLSHSQGFQEINTDFFVTYEDEETLNFFDEMIENAEQQEGIVDIAEPEYDFEALYADESSQQFHLWVGEADQRSTLMYVEDSHTVYMIAVEDTKKLIELLNE